MGRGAIWLGVAAALAAPALGAAKKPLCPPARYATVGAAIGPGGGDVAIEVGPDVAIPGRCTRVDPRALRGTRKGTRVRARWDACEGFASRVAVRALTAADCTRLVGTIRSSGESWPFEAERVDCGDGILDAAVPAFALDGLR